MLGGVSPPRVRRLRAALLLAAAALVLTGCGSAPGTIGPTGVDELTIPTPSADPGDFVTEVDNRWLPLPDGASWTYSVTGPEANRTIEVVNEVTGPGPEVMGVPTTELLELSVDATGEVLARVRSWYAQDRPGNVWLFGREVERAGEPVPEDTWRAESAGGAGLAMPAEPRIGDGFVVAPATGAEERAAVAALDGVADTGLGRLTGLLVLERDMGDTTVQLLYAPDVGLVAVDAGLGGMTLKKAEVPGRS